ncbi:MAG TPA: hypothetical protein QGG47_17060 [Acidobacteriota bacterium]|nr:hypothetical protein [Acidobacteriota bacterium]
MRCPNCRAEYRPSFKICADCGVALELAGEADAPADPDTPADWTPLCTLSSESEAHLLQGYLESEGVPCSIESLVFHAEPFTFGPLAKVRIHVLSADRIRAERLLHDRGVDASADTP